MQWKRICILIYTISAIFLTALHSAPSPIKDEYHRKAAIIRAISQYVQWPENSAMKTPSASFVIGIIGKSPFGPILEKAYEQEKFKIKDKNVEVRYISEPDEIENCHILFISKSKEKELAQIIAVTRERPILTVGEKKGFAQKGVLLNLYISKGEIRFEINTSAVRESRLIVDSELLSVARIIQPLEGGK